MTLRSDRRRRAQAGFTLIEVIVVLAIVGLALGIVAARGPLGVQTLSIRGTANELAQGFRQARAEAILHNRPALVAVDLERRSWRVGNGPPRHFPTGLDVRVTTVAGLDIPGRQAAFRFEPDGSSTGGRVVLAGGGRRLLVGVDWISSRVSIVDGP